MHFCDLVSRKSDAFPEITVEHSLFSSCFYVELFQKKLPFYMAILVYRQLKAMSFREKYKTLFKIFKVCARCGKISSKTDIYRY